MNQRDVVLERVGVERQHWEDFFFPLISALLELADSRPDANTIRSHMSLSGASNTLVRSIKRVAHSWREARLHHSWREARLQGSAAQPVHAGFADPALPVEELARQIAEEAGGVGFQNSVHLMLLKMDSSNTIRVVVRPATLSPDIARYLRAVIISVLSVVSLEMVETRVLHSLAPIGAAEDKFAERQAFEAGVIEEELCVARMHEGSMRRAMVEYVKECAAVG